MSGWDDVTVIRKRPANATSLKTESAVNAARRAGASISSEKKGSHTNQNVIGVDAGKAAKIDRETEDFHVERVGLSLGKAIQQARQTKNMTQKDLATKINEKQTVVNEYESGKAPNPNQQILAKMERILGIKLRGKDIGAPLAGPKK
ncbi:multi protein bridging factor 1-domain-containing protein [Blyttiomyces helicus]|uniref:Multi protein bridging factor 1-domain-containing protein n=1 Tax=Blyttiomyces helicus TaxID=388810 RepID=A0A4P9WL37_9FUNG|nr:multi protein bridging factor 1-domain-containing protein [Blyttiomyces helicus]|eukprot:RKO92763.1 multi protein bridging factor 1-domain-containing protein [Blyttiomyces helicus]